MTGVTPLDARASLALGDAFEVLAALPPASVHAVVTDPPYSPLEYAPDQQEKLRRGKGGVWRIPPTLDGVTRRPLPRFTVLEPADLAAMDAFFARLAEALRRVLVPGAHVFLAANPLLSDVAFAPFRRAGFEKRGEIVRLLTTLRGGDRPKGAHDRFPEVSVMPRSGHEPWGLFRAPLDGTVAATLDRHGTGGLRRPAPDVPFTDVVPCAPARGAERAASDHPSLKPQRFLRQVVRAALPLGRGLVLDPFAGSGSTLAAASAVGVDALGIERDAAYHAAAVAAFPVLRDLQVRPLR